MEGIGTNSYISAHNQILAHAKAYRLYHNEFYQTQKGAVGITLNVDWFEPLNSTNVDHITACVTKLEFYAGWFANPIFIDGKYPRVMRENIDRRSIAQGFSESRLPHFTEQETQEIKG